MHDVIELTCLMNATVEPLKEALEEISQQPEGAIVCGRVSHGKFTPLNKCVGAESALDKPSGQPGKTATPSLQPAKAPAIPAGQGGGKPSVKPSSPETPPKKKVNISDSHCVKTVQEPFPCNSGLIALILL